MAEELTAELLKRLLDYDPETGVFTRKACLSRTGNLVPSVGAAKAGTEAGWLDGHGYVRIRAAGSEYAAHRLAWLYVHGEWPSACIDHIDGQRTNNRITNLRLATIQQNSENVRTARSRNKLGLLGVFFDKARGKYIAQIRAAGRNRYLGAFETPEQAHQCYLEAKRELHAFATV